MLTRAMTIPRFALVTCCCALVNTLCITQLHALRNADDAPTAGRLVSPTLTSVGAANAISSASGAGESTSSGVSAAVGDAVPTPRRERTKPPAVHPKPLIGILSQPGDGDGGLAPRLGEVRCSRRTGSRGRLGSQAAGVAADSSCSGSSSSSSIGGSESSSSSSSSSNMFNGNVSYIAASYVKWVESAGARPVPILYDEEPATIARKFRAVNGLIIPGGGTVLEPGPFFSAVELLLNLALEANDKGDYFPVQGTCMGLEALTIFVSQNYSILQLRKFNAEDNPTPLKFAGEWAKSRGLFSWMSPRLLRHVETEPLTMENHSDGTTVDQFMSSARLTVFFDVLTTSFDKNGTEYISTVEGKKYPFYGTQWHPEKNAFEWGLDHIPHTADGVAVCQAAANFFVNEARRSRHAPQSMEEMDEFLIYNYDPIFSGKNGKGFFEQSYVFKKPVPVEP